MSGETRINHWMKVLIVEINIREYRRGKSKMDNPEKLVTKGKQDREKQKINTTQYVLDTTISCIIRMRSWIFSIQVTFLHRNLEPVSCFYATDLKSVV